MSSAEILEKIRQVMIDVFNRDGLLISPDTSAADIEEWDSLSYIRLIVALETTFRIKFKNSEIENLRCVGDLVGLVAAKAGY